MQRLKINLAYSILIEKPKEIVWDYTQDYSLRTTWDSTVSHATVIQSEPTKIVRLKLKGFTTLNYVYKWEDRPNKTTLTATDIHSSWINAIGGSWLYEEVEGKTRWTQKGTIELKNNLLLQLLNPLFSLLFHMQLRASMLKAKKQIELL